MRTFSASDPGMWWRPPAALAAVPATIPVWGKLSVLEIGAALVVPIIWIFFLKTRAAILLIGWVAVAAAMMGGLASWGAPATFDDYFRGYLFVVWLIGVPSAWRGLRPGARIAIVTLACVTVVSVPDVREVPLPGRGAMMPEPAGVLVVSEHAGCTGPAHCERLFETMATDGADREELKQRLTRHLQRRGWAINSQHVDQACRPVGLLLNPYRGCVSLHYNHVTGRTEVLHRTFNPREPIIVY